jgi:hypothetical protein
VLVFSKEMPYQQLRDRLFCIRAKLDYSVMRGGIAESDLHDAYNELLEQINSRGDQLHITNNLRSISALDALIQKLEPHVVMLDSAYQISDGSEGKAKHEMLNAVSTRMKEMAMQYNIGIISVYQENERLAIEHAGKGRGTSAFAGSTAVLQDADIAIRAVMNTHMQQISLTLPAARETNFQGFSINAKPAGDFTFAGFHIWPVGWTPPKEETKSAGNVIKELAGLSKLLGKTAGGSPI